MLVWMHDNLSLRAKGIAGATGLTVAVSCHAVFAVIWKWA